MLGPMVALGGATTDVTGEAPDGPPTNVSVFSYGSGKIGVQWTTGDPLAQTQLSRTGGAEPTSVDYTRSAGATSFETEQAEEFFWWARHIRNGQTSDWVLATVPDTDTGVDPDDPIRPVIDSVNQLTLEEECSGFGTGNVNLQLKLTMVGSSRGTLQERVNGGSWSTVASSIAAGAPSYNRYARDPGKLYEYRIRYNDVSPDTWSTVKGRTTVCSLA